MATKKKAPAKKKPRMETSIEQVKIQQEWLNSHGWRDGAGNLLEVDGKLGPKTVQAIKNFQGSVGLVDDGTWGPLTWDKVDQDIYSDGRNGGLVAPGSKVVPGVTGVPGTSTNPPPAQPYTPPPTQPLPPPSQFKPPTSVTPPGGATGAPPGTPGATPGGANQPQVSPSARAEMRRMLEEAGLGELADAAYELQKQGITDPQQLLYELEDTEAFRFRFPGIRDPATGEKVMSVSEYVSYERSVQEQGSAFGLDLSRAQIGAMAQQRRAVTEIRADLQAIRQLAADPFARNEFYAYTGIMPDEASLFALALGLPEAMPLQQEYDRATAAGVSAAEFNGRLAGVGSGPRNNFTAPAGTVFAQDMVADPVFGDQITRQQLYERHGVSEPAQVSGPFRTIGDVTGALTPQGAGFAASAAGPVANRYDRLRAIQKAEQSSAARFKAGGMQEVSQKLGKQTI